MIVTRYRFSDSGHGHFCRALHVAMQSGLYHPSEGLDGPACSL